MRKNVFKLAMIVMALFLSTACFAQAGKVNNFRIKRGTNVSHWLSQSEQRGEARRLHIQEDDFARLESLGFDFVRIPIDEVQFSTICVPSWICTSSAHIILMLSTKLIRLLTPFSPQRRRSRI